jgi:hypothetical protein
MNKKFYLVGMTVLVSVSLFMIGCPTDPDPEYLPGKEIEVVVPGPDVEVPVEVPIHPDTLVTTAAGLRAALLLENVNVIALDEPNNNPVTVSGTKDAPFVINKTLLLFSPVNIGPYVSVYKPVYIYSGGSLDASNGLVVSSAPPADEPPAGEDSESVISKASGGTGNDAGGSITVYRGGKLAVIDLENVNDGKLPLKTVIGDRSIVKIQGTLGIPGITLEKLQRAAGCIEDDASLEVDARGVSATAMQAIQKRLAELYPNMKVLIAQVGDGSPETAPSFEIPEGGATTVPSDDPLSSLEELTVSAGGSFTADAATGSAGGIKLVIGDGASAVLGGDQIAAIKAGSTIGAGATLTVKDVLSIPSPIAVGAGATINGITFPDAVSVTGILADEIAVEGDWEVPAAAPLIIDTDKTLVVSGNVAVAGDVAVDGNLALEGTIAVAAGGSFTAPAISAGGTPEAGHQVSFGVDSSIAVAQGAALGFADGDATDGEDTSISFVGGSAPLYKWDDDSTGGVITLKPNNVTEMTGNLSVVTNTGVAPTTTVVITTGGQLTIPAGKTFTNGGTITNAGAIIVDGGTYDVAVAGNAGTNTGSVTVKSGGTIKGTATTRVTGAGLNTVEKGGKAYIGDDLIIGPVAADGAQIQIASGSFSYNDTVYRLNDGSAAALTVDRLVVSGTTAPAAVFTIGANSVLTVKADKTLSLNAATVDSTLIQPLVGAAGAQVVLEAGAKLGNAGGTLNFYSNASTALTFTDSVYTAGDEGATFTWNASVGSNAGGWVLPAVEP